MWDPAAPGVENAALAALPRQTAVPGRATDPVSTQTIPDSAVTDPGGIQTAPARALGQAVPGASEAYRSYALHHDVAVTAEALQSAGLSLAQAYIYADALVSDSMSLPLTDLQKSNLASLRADPVAQSVWNRLRPTLAAPTAATQTPSPGTTIPVGTSADIQSNSSEAKPISTTAQAQEAYQQEFRRNQQGLSQLMASGEITGQGNRVESIEKAVDNSGNFGIITMDVFESIDLQSDFGRIVDRQTPVGKDYARAIKTTFNRGLSIAKKVFTKYVRPDSVESTTSDGSYFDRNTRKIYLKAWKDFNQDIGVGANYFHEHGHYIDFFAAGANNYNYLSMQNKLFGEKLRSDYARYLQKTIESINIVPDDVENIIRTELKDKKKQGISDIIDGLTDGKVFGCASHSQNNPNYWKVPGKVEREAFANMFQACFIPESARFMSIYFPEAYGEFKKMLKELL